jgi:hypothetical protein
MKEITMIPMEKTVTTLFNKLGTKGTHKGHQVLFLLSEPDEVVGVGFIKAHTSTTILKIRINDAPDLAVGDEIVSADKTYRVMSEPTQNFNGLIWTAECD